MSKRHHINPKTGNSNICDAKPGRCPFRNEDGSEAPHYESKREAQVAYEQQMEAELFAEAPPSLNHLSNRYHNLAYLEEFRQRYQNNADAIEGLLGFEKELTETLESRFDMTPSHAMVGLDQDGNVDTNLSIYEKDDLATVQIAARHEVGKLYNSTEGALLRPFVVRGRSGEGENPRLNISLFKLRKEGQQSLEHHRAEARTFQMQIDESKRILKEAGYAPGAPRPEGSEYTNGYMKDVKVGDWVQLSGEGGTGTRKVVHIKPFRKNRSDWVRFTHDDGSTSEYRAEQYGSRIVNPDTDEA